MAGSLALLALNQFRKLNKFNDHRRKIAQYYFNNLNIKNISLPKNVKEAIWLRFPIEVQDKTALINFAKKRGVMLGDWYKGTIQPAELSSINYKLGSCPKAEKASLEIVNLPTYSNFTLDDARHVVRLIKQWINSN
jgi:dTDP-4-amino-4,6-dideoxygalactose transaminase